MERKKLEWLLLSKANPVSVRREGIQTCLATSIFAERCVWIQSCKHNDRKAGFIIRFKST